MGIFDSVQKLSDRMLERLVPRVVAAAGCPTEYYWGQCYAGGNCWDLGAQSWLQKRYVITQSCTAKPTGTIRCCMG